MRTNIIIDDKLMSEALAVSECRTKKEAVDEALKLFVAMKRQESIRASRGTLVWEGNLEKMRTDKT